VKRLGGFWLAAAILAGCRLETPVPPDVVAEVAGEALRYESFERYLDDQVGEEAGGLDSVVLSHLFDQYLDEQLLRRRVEEEGLAPAGVSARRAAEVLLAGPEEAVPSAAVETWYRRHAEEYVLPERVRLRQILVSDAETAARARRRIEDGEDFASVARNVSEGPNAERGGDQGELAREDLPRSYAEAVFALDAGEVSPVLESPDGFRLFQVVERLPRRILPVETVAGEIEEELRRQERDRRLVRVVGECRRRYNVQIHAENLPFDYRGAYPDAT
jgi:peptidyl-prolyl cis-trans isomerase C